MSSCWPAAAAVRWLRGTLVGAQVAVCLVVLIAAGLLARGLNAAQHIDPGFNTHSILSANFDLRREGYDEARVSCLQGATARTYALLCRRCAMYPFPPCRRWQEWRGAKTSCPRALAKRFSPCSMPCRPPISTCSVFLLSPAASFTEQEVDTSAKVAVISQSGARKLWPGQNPIGKRFRFGDDKVYTEVIGVAHDAYMTNLNRIRDLFHVSAREEH